MNNIRRIFFKYLTNVRNCNRFTWFRQFVESHNDELSYFLVEKKLIRINRYQNNARNAIFRRLIDLNEVCPETTACSTNIMGDICLETQSKPIIKIDFREPQ